MKTPTSTLRRKFEAYQKSPHELLRHSLASLLIAKRLDPVFVSRQLGHSSPQITLRVYAHLFEQADHAVSAREALEASYALIAAAPGAIG